ncbi:hypothetical protein QUA20_17545 [Microcoleus sp. Pol7_A1]
MPEVINNGRKKEEGRRKKEEGRKKKEEKEEGKKRMRFGGCCNMKLY